MAQRDQIGEPQRRQRAVGAMPAGRERAEIAVGKRQGDQIGRRLLEIVGGRRLVKRVAVAVAAMHARSDPQRCLDGGAIDVVAFGDDDQLRRSRRITPRTVELAAHPFADGLHQ